MSGGSQITLDIQNLFDARPDASLADGRPAPGYGRDDRDPLGRQIRLQFAKRF
jgi:outer membrane receptor protein involved in Fe transport